MSAFRLAITFDWPHELPSAPLDVRARPKTMQDLLFELLEPLNRDNVTWYEAGFELVRSPDGDY
jgi:hypothetical protein